MMDEVTGSANSDEPTPKPDLDFGASKTPHLKIQFIGLTQGRPMFQGNLVDRHPVEN